MRGINQESNMTEAGTPAVTSSPSFSRRQTLVASALFAPGAALLAGLLAVVLMLFLRVFAGIPTPMELFGDFALRRLDANTFVGLLLKFSPNSKTAPLGLALLGMIGLGIALGVLYAALVRLRLPVSGYRPTRREWLVALAFAAGMTLIGTVLFWSQLPQNFFGLPLGQAVPVTILGLLADFVLYGTVLCLAYRALLPKLSAPGVPAAVQGRRQLFARAGVAALSVGGVAGSYGLVRKFLQNYTSYDGFKLGNYNRATPAITTNSDHYVVTQNTVDPSPNIDLWRLEVSGLVNKPGSYTFAEVQQLPSTSRPITLECIANGRGDHLISTAIWQGVTLRTLLERHGGAQSAASHVAFYSIDGYSVSQPLKEVLEVDALLAWRMNGSELPQRHGYPMRVLIPGHFGEENPKWLTRVELTDHFVGGLYSDQGWYNGQVHTISRIDRPRDHVPVGQPVEVDGIAYAGARGIQKVEVSTDGGTSWQQTTLQPALSQDAWVLWSWQWRPLLPGKYTLVCRATDGTGELQTSKDQNTVPGGGTGYHKIEVQVS